ncbi:hypothetical protein A6A04_20320 [Paramagnetospirillum marisnigri]|uniref:Protein kinase domain-containing protein n=2 Tax=Paramagnetospirillum marisnigri TaxID=1285242 RepID=A0A178MHN3_9PROT|nr:hypothetical protein A6A04_20320 [Paramagnetospirillum marisnigri]
MTERIGPYRVVRFLIKTAFSRLFLADDDGLGRRVVIKVFDVDPVTPEPPFPLAEWHRRFLLEGRIMARLDHPNLLGVHEMGITASNAPYLVLPFMQANLPRLIGLDLGPGQREGASEIELPKALPQAEAIRILGRILDAVAYLHAKGMVHRDIKPANILLSVRENGQPKLCDFGMVKLGSARDVPPGAWIGTPAYLSPEQLADAGLASSASDVFSMGVLAWRMLLGELPPVDGPIPPDALAALPSHLAKAITAAMAPDPAARPTAAGMRQTLLGLPALG